MAAAAVIAIAALSPRTSAGSRPAGWQSVLFVAAFVLFLGALGTLADVLGTEDLFDSSGTLVWVGLLLVALAAWFARTFDSGISTLLATVTLAAVIVAFVDWVFSPEEVDTFRWVLLAIAVGFAAVGESRRVADPDHAAGWVNASGLALLTIALTFAAAAVVGAVGFGTGPSGSEVGAGWELVILAGGALLVVWSVLAAKAGPGYLGVANLFAFAVLAAVPGEDGPSLIGWPIVLVIATAALLVAAFRGSGPPGAGVPARPGPAPSEAPTAAQPPA